MGYKFELFGRLKNKPTNFSEGNGNSSDPLSMSMLAQPPQTLTPSSQSPQGNPSANPSQPPSSPQGSLNPSGQDPKKLILEYSSRGMPESEIIKNLKMNGFTFEQIDSALSEALKSKVDNRPITSDGVLRSTPNETHLETFHQPKLPNQVTEHNAPSSDELEAMVERVVEDRVTSLKSLISNLDNSMDDIKSEINDLDKSIRLLETKTDEKIASINTDFQRFRVETEDIEPRIKSIEKAFKDTVPSLVEDVRESVALVKNIRAKTRIEPKIDYTTENKN